MAKCNRYTAGAGVAVGLILVGGLAGFLGWFFTRGEETPATGGPYYYKEAVATDNEECSVIGESILTKGGSAVDAAIATMFCLGVINMYSSGIGGGGVMLVYNRSHGEANVIDFRETAPASVTNFTADSSGVNESKAGGLSIAVPGEVHGMYRASRDYGRLPWKDLVQPAINLARDGFRISAALGTVLKHEKTIEYIKEDDGLRELLIDKNGEPYKENDTITNKKYANTLEEIREDPETFYNGQLAQKIVQDMRLVSKRGNRTDEGKVTLNDLRDYQTVTREPLKGNLSGMTMYLTPPPTSGAVLALILNILKGYDLTSSDRDDLNSSILTYHRIIEAFKFAYAWRSRLGDPAFNQEKEINKIAQQMVEEELGNKLRSKITDDRTHDVSYYAQFFSQADIGTTHISVLAENGDAVSVTTTINLWFGSKFRSNVTGIIYNNQMADFDIPGYHIVDGISPSEVNFPAPGKRPFSSMSPAILTDDKGEVHFVIGASGGKKITTAVSLVLMNRLWFDKSLSDAVDEPRVHNELVPDQNVDIEDDDKYRLDSKIVKGLEDRGHEVRNETSFAVVQAVYRKAEHEIDAQSDPRKHGKPAGQ